MKTAKQWIESYDRGDSPNEREIGEIQADAKQAGLELAIERMKEFWGHEIVRVIARDLCRKNGLDVPKLPFDPARNPPTPSEVPPPRARPLDPRQPSHSPDASAGLEPVYPPPVTEPGPLFPSQSPPPASPPPKDFVPESPPPAVELDPRFLNPVQEVLNATVRQVRREVAERLESLEQRLKLLEKLVPLPKGCERVSETERYQPDPNVLHQSPIEAPPGDYEGQQVNAVLKWTGGQWLLLQSHPR